MQIFYGAGDCTSKRASKDSTLLVSDCRTSFHFCNYYHNSLSFLLFYSSRFYLLCYFLFNRLVPAWLTQIAKVHVFVSIFSVHILRESFLHHFTELLNNLFLNNIRIHRSYLEDVMSLWRKSNQLLEASILLIFFFFEHTSR